MMRFHLDATDGTARAGTFTLRGQAIPSPCFMPVATRGAVRGQTVETLKRAGSRILLANTLHLHQRPGVDTLRALGGLHRLMGWDGGLLTDSGGYQVFSLGARISEDGASFQDPSSGRVVFLRPEDSLATQGAIGSDIAMVLDVCLPADADHAAAADALSRTTRWAHRCLAAKNPDQALFAIVQGATFPDLRQRSAAELTPLPFDGFAIGGLAVGEEAGIREDLTALSASLLPADKPRYLMGVGTPMDLLAAMNSGVDCFDCILPVAHAQHGIAYTWDGRLDLRRGVYARDDRPLDASCPCPVCATASRAWLHHLVKCEEVLGWQLVGEHNLHHMHALVARARRAIVDGAFGSFYREHRERLAARDPDHPTTAPTPKRRKPPPPTTLGDYEIVVRPGAGLEAGSAAVRQRSTGETMHAVSDPLEEARALYVGPSRLAALLATDGPPLVLWDVGLGAGTNAFAALTVPRRRPLHLFSFEADLDPLRLAALHPWRFPQGQHRGVHAILREGRFAEDLLEWTLILGDLRETLERAPSPDVVFWDPFSYKADSDLWTPTFFARLRAACRRSTVHTYTNATACRGAMLAAGFYVGRGPATGPKTETTVAFTHPDDAAPGQLLDRAWLDRWSASSARWPEEVRRGGAEAMSAYEQRLRGHPQFA
jgi:queuine tRNA-ribosyltransferase